MDQLINLNLKNAWLEGETQVFIVEELSAENQDEVISTVRVDYSPKLDCYQYFKVQGEEITPEIWKEIKSRLDEMCVKIKDGEKLLEP